MVRPNWDEYFLGFLPAIASRATCDRGRNSCILVDKDQQIISTGYVGSVTGDDHCDTHGHLMDVNGKHCIRTAHAEMNAIAQAAKRGVSTLNATLYTSMEPCKDCAKLIIQCGIKRVVCEYEYHASNLTRRLFKKVGMELTVLNNKTKEYES